MENDELQKLRTENIDLRLLLAKKEGELKEYRRILAKIAEYADNLVKESSRVTKTREL